MTVIVTKLPGGVSQLFNPDTGKITYKSKLDEAYLKINAFNGIVKFNKKGSRAIVDGPNTTIEDCEIIKPDNTSYNDALQKTLNFEKKFKEEQISQLKQEVDDINSNIPV